MYSSSYNSPNLGDTYVVVVIMFACFWREQRAGCVRRLRWKRCTQKLRLNDIRGNITYRRKYLQSFADHGTLRCCLCRLHMDAGRAVHGEVCFVT